MSNTYYTVEEIRKRGKNKYVTVEEMRKQKAEEQKKQQYYKVEELRAESQKQNTPPLPSQNNSFFGNVARQIYGSASDEATAQNNAYRRMNLPDHPSYTDVSNEMNRLQNIRGGAARRGRGTDVYDKALSMLKGYADKSYSFGNITSAQDRLKLYEDKKRELEQKKNDLNSRLPANASREEQVAYWLPRQEEKASAEKAIRDLEQEIKIYERDYAGDFYNHYKSDPDYKDLSQKQNIRNEDYQVRGVFGEIEDTVKGYSPKEDEDDKLGAYLQAYETYWDMPVTDDIKHAPFGIYFDNIIEEGDKNYWKLINDDEKEMYYYLYNKEGKDAAYEYLDKLAPVLGARNKNKIAEETAGSEGLDLLLRNADTVPAKIGGSLTSVADDAANLLTGKEINPYNSAHELSQFADTTREITANKIENATGGANIGGFTFGDAYQSVMSAGDMVAASALFGGNSAAVGFAMSMDAARAKAQELYDKGATNEQIIAESLAAGAFEAIFETLSLDLITDKIVKGMLTKKTAPRFIAAALMAAGVEGSEEVFTDIANYVTDIIIMRDKSERQQLIKDYVKAGYSKSEAEQKATDEFKQNLWKSFMGGAVAGGLFAGSAYASPAINAAVINSNQRKSDRNTGALIYDANNVPSLVKQANAINANTEGAADIQKQAAKVQKLYEKQTAKNEKSGGDTSSGKLNKEAGTLYNMLRERDYSEIDSASSTLQTTVRDKVIAATGTENAVAESAIIKSEITGDQLTEEEQAAINTPEIQTAIQELRESGELNNAVTAVDNALSNYAKTNRLITERTDDDLFTSNDDGKTYVKGSDEPINIISIASVGADDITMRTDDGETVSAKDIDFPNSDTAAVLAGLIDIQKSVGTKMSSDVANMVMTAANIGINNGTYSDNIGALVNDVRNIYQDAYWHTGTDTPAILTQGDAQAIAKAAQAEVRAASETPAIKKPKKTGAVVFEDGVKRSDYKDNSRRGVSIDLIDNLAKSTGITFHFYKSEVNQAGKRVSQAVNAELGTSGKNAPNGFYHNGEIWIDVNAGQNGEGLILFTASHELVHFIKEGSPADFNALAEFLMDKYGDKKKNVHNYIQAEMRRNHSLTPNEAYEEVVARMCESFLTDIHLSDKAAELYKKNRSLAEKIRDWLSKFRDRIATWYKGVSQNSQYASDGQAIAQKFNKAYDLYIQGIRNASENMRNAAYTEKATGEGGVRFTTREDYNKAVDKIEKISDEEYLEEKAKYPYVVMMDSTPAKLLTLDPSFKDRPVIIRRDALYLAVRKFGVQKGHYHSLGVDVLKKLPDYLSDPDVILHMNNGRKAVLFSVPIKTGVGFASVEFETIAEIGDKYSKYNIVVTVMDIKDRYFKSLILNRGAEIAYKREALAQVNPKLYKWLDIVNAKTSNTDIIPDSSEKYNPSDEKTIEELSDKNTHFSLREEDPPKKTIIGYKVFRVKDGKLYPPMVANPGGQDTPVGVWLNADVGERAPDSKTGRAQVKGKGGMSLSFRPGWHLGDIPRASQFDRMNPDTGVKDMFPADFVWAECDCAADVDYQDEAMSYGYTDNGKFRHAYAGLPRVPENGYYKYRTNPRPDTVPWIITGAIKVNRILSDAEVAEILKKNGVTPPQRQGGNKTLEQLGLNNNHVMLQSRDTDYMSAVNRGDMQTAQRMVDKAAERAFPDSKVRTKDGKLKTVYHGTGREFNVFDNSRIGANYDGWSELGKGFYATDNLKTAKHYAERSKGDRSKIIEGYIDIKKPLYVYETLPDDIDLSGIVDKYNIPNWVADSMKRNAGRMIDVLIDSGEDVQSFIKQFGYDGIIEKSVKGDMFQIVFFDSNQFKSADPVTYDDDGNVIPLSQRFDTSQQDIRYDSRVKFDDWAEMLSWDDDVPSEDASDTELIRHHLVTHNEAIGEILNRTRDMKLSPEEMRRNIKAVLSEYGFNRQSAQNISRAVEDVISVIEAGIDMSGDDILHDIGDAVYNELLDGKYYEEGVKERYDELIALLSSYKNNGTKFYLTDRQLSNLKEIGMTFAEFRAWAARKENGMLQIVKDKNLRGAIRLNLEDLEYFRDVFNLDNDSDWNWDSMTDEAPRYLYEGIENLKRQMEINADEYFRGETDEVANRITAAIIADVVEKKYKSAYGGKSDLFVKNAVNRAVEQAVSEQQKIADERVLVETERSRQYVEETVAALRAERDAAIQEQKKKDNERIAEFKRKQRERTERLVKEEKDKRTEQRKKEHDRRKRTELRGKIRRLKESFDRRLTKPKEGQYIPRELISQTVSILNAIDLDSYRSTRLTEKIKGLYAEYEKLKNNSEAYAVYDPVMSSILENLSDTVGDTPIMQMSLYQLGAVYQSLRSLDEVIRNSVRMVDSEFKQTAHAVGREWIAEINQIKGHKRNPFRDYNYSMLRADVMFNRIAGWKKNSISSRLCEMLNNGQLRTTQLEMEFSMIFDDLMTDYKQLHSLSDTKNLVDIGLKDQSGNTVKITRGMMLSLYMHLLNEDNTRHVMGGGLTVPDMKSYYRGDMANAYGNGQTSVRADVDYSRYVQGLKSAIEEILTPYEMAWINAAAEFFDVASKNAINETTMALYHFNKATVNNYFPIHTDPDYRAASFDDIRRDMSLENSGFMKERVHASNPILLEDITDVINNQVQMVAKYCGMTIAIKNFEKVYGTTTREFESSVQKALKTKFSGSATAYIDNLLTDLTSGRTVSDKLTKFNNRLGKVRGNLAQATLTLNPSVAFSQAASYPTAAAVIGWKPLMKALAVGGKNGHPFSRADKTAIADVTPLLWKRQQGYSTVEIGDLKNKRVSKHKTMNKLKKAFAWIEFFDGATVGRLYTACEYYVDENYKELKKGSEEYKEKVAETYNRVIERTQPNYTTMQRPDILRNPNEIVKSLTMFMTQRLQNFNIVYDAIGEYSRTHSDLKKGLNGVTAEDNRQARVKVWRAVSSQFAAAMTIVAMKTLVSFALYNIKRFRNDDDELTAENLWWGMLDNFADTILGNVLFGSDVYSLFKNKVFNTPYYGLSMSGVDSIKGVVDAFTDLDFSDLTLKDAHKLLLSGCQLFGIPLKNAEKIGTAAYYYIKDGVEGTLGEYEQGVNRTAKQNMHRIELNYLNGDPEKARDIHRSMYEDKVNDYLAKGETKQDAEKKAKSYMRGRYTATYKDRYVEAIKNNDTSIANDIRNILQFSGVYDDLNKALESWTK